MCDDNVKKSIELVNKSRDILDKRIEKLDSKVEAIDSVIFINESIDHLAKEIYFETYNYENKICNAYSALEKLCKQKYDHKLTYSKELGKILQKYRIYKNEDKSYNKTFLVPTLILSLIIIVFSILYFNSIAAIFILSFILIALTIRISIALHDYIWKNWKIKYEK